MNFTTVKGIENLVYVERGSKYVKEIAEVIVRTGGFMYVYINDQVLEHLEKQTVIIEEEKEVMRKLHKEGKGFIMTFKEVMDTLKEEEVFALLAHEDGHLKFKHYENVTEENIQGGLLYDTDKELEADAYGASLTSKKIMKRGLQKAMIFTFELYSFYIRKNPFIEDPEKVIAEYKKNYFYSEGIMKRLEALS